MALSLQERENQISLIENQADAVKQITKIDAPTGLGFFYEKYLENTYHFAKYDLNNDKMLCFKIATIFSNHPDIFLGRRRTEIQLDNNSVTLSVNDWIKCTRLPEVEMTFSVEYYLYTVNNFPVIIFFRIKKSVDDYEIKLKSFINYLIGTQLLTDKCEAIMIEDKVEDEIIGEHRQSYITQDTGPQSTPLVDMDNETEFVATVAFVSVAHKGFYITILVCGVIMTYYFVESLTSQDNGQNTDHNQFYKHSVH